ncbi:MAG: alpha/beta fold hydrolase, partial [Cryobacterium sp.]|nr:alpha/beta fold hydrolase [Cryobacterium sp.]
AGAGPHTLMPLINHIPDRFDVVGVTLPGRESRSAENFTTTPSDPQAAVDAVLQEIVSLPALPTVLFGHSMGAALAAAVALSRPDPFTAVVLSAYPLGGSAAHRAGRWQDSEMLAIVRQGRGTPEEVTGSPAWRRRVLDLLRSDLTLSVRLVVGVGTRQPAVPVTVLCGDADHVVATPDPVGWERNGDAAVRFRTFPGGHFYLLDEANMVEVATEISRAFAR